MYLKAYTSMEITQFFQDKLCNFYRIFSDHILIFCNFAKGKYKVLLCFKKSIIYFILFCFLLREIISNELPK